MKQSEKMKKAVLSTVVPHLEENGFRGEYPHYRRKFEDRVEVLCFRPNKHGNALQIDISTAFMREKNANVNRMFHGDFGNVTVSDCKEVYRLQGNFGDSFYYTDVYIVNLLGGIVYQGVSEEQAKNGPLVGFHLPAQKATEKTVGSVCKLMIERMKKAYRWWDKMRKNECVAGNASQKKSRRK